MWLITCTIGVHLMSKSKIKPTIQVIIGGIYLQSVGEESTNSYVGLALQYLRKSKDLSQVQVCVDTDMSKSNFYKLERGSANITMDHLDLFSKALDTTPCDILNLSETIKNQSKGEQHG